MRSWALRQKGFTIVELLIVVVVIAILAAITIVAYNGIQNRAKASSAQSSAAQAAKKISSYAVTNAEVYPDTLADADVTTTSNENFNYYVNNTANPRDYCTSAVNKQNQSIAFVVTSKNGSAVPGVCAENLVGNSSFEQAFNAPWYPEGSVSVGWDTSLVADGTRSVRVTKIASGTPGNAIYRDVPVEVGKRYVLSYSVARASGSGNYLISIRDPNGSSYLTPASYIAPPSTMTRYNHEFTPLTTGNARLFIRTGSGAVGDAISVDAVSVTAGSTPFGYGDASSQQWAWNGDFGPAAPLQ